LLTPADADRVKGILKSPENGAEAAGRGKY
jgi:hypothetical protein